MSTGEKERRVINRAVRVLDEIESRIHELREELEANGMATGRGRKAKADDAHHDDADHGDEHETPARARKATGKDEGNLHGAAKAAHDAKADKGHDDAHDDEPHARGGKATGKDEGNLHGAAKAAHDAKADKGHDDEPQAKGAKHDAGDEDREPHGQGRVKHPETDKRLKGHKDDHETETKAEKAKA